MVNKTLGKRGLPPVAPTALLIDALEKYIASGGAHVGMAATVIMNVVKGCGHVGANFVKIAIGRDPTTVIPKLVGYMQRSDECLARHPLSLIVSYCELGDPQAVIRAATAAGVIRAIFHVLRSLPHPAVSADWDTEPNSEHRRALAQWAALGSHLW